MFATPGVPVGTVHAVDLKNELIFLGGVGVFVITDLSSLPKRPGAEVFGLRGEEMLRLSLPNLPIAEDLQVSSTDFLRWWRYQLLDVSVTDAVIALPPL